MRREMPVAAATRAERRLLWGPDPEVVALSADFPAVAYGCGQGFLRAALVEPVHARQARLFREQGLEPGAYEEMDLGVREMVVEGSEQWAG